QESFQPAPLIPAADAPNGRRITFQPGGKGGDGFTRGNAKHDAGMLDLEPSQAPAMGDAVQNGHVSGCKRQAARFAATHRATLQCQSGVLTPPYRSCEFLA